MGSFGAHAATTSLYKVVPITVSSTIGLEAYGSAIDENGNIAGDTRNGTDGIPFRDEASFGIDNTFTYLDWSDLESYCYRHLGYNSCENWAEREWHGINDAGGLEREREAYYDGYTANANAFDNTGTQLMQKPTSDYLPGGTDTFVEGSNNVVVNKFSVDDQVLGTTSSGYYKLSSGNYGLAYRERGFVGDTILPPATTFNGDPVSDIVTKMGRTMAFDSFEYPADSGDIYIVGSASVAPFDYSDGNKDYDGRDVSRCFSGDTPIADPGAEAYCQNFAFATKAFVWNSADTTGVSVAAWGATETIANRDKKSYMSSVRGAVVPDHELIANEGTTDVYPDATDYDGKPVLVGYNTRRDDNNLLMQAAIYYPKDTTGDLDLTQDDQWDSKFISNAEVEVSGDYIYSNTRATDINNNLLVIGESKRSGYYPENGAAASRMFVADAGVETPSATYLSTTGESIFFTGSGGKAEAVNNYNEIVGTIDAETAREYGGKQRRHRGFINPYEFTGTHAKRRALFQDKSWFLDDLTNDDDVSGTNNHYRIIAASDINDNGEISATALYCADGFDNTGHNAYCGGGTGVETVVAVKLVPNVDLNDEDASVTITPRSVAQETISRQGGSLGPWALFLLTIVGLRRRQKQ
ncbi:hypothetical protein A9264_03420 [Vibrio sp. UCD-FRSSP16_10]|nr:hypothetical protein A9260_04870 [Vibrio sp. UCD-FRSSP16_30]OBT20555.1 hypothetical protein A9264_03420 [Vibrio sp. UCD-FRSSP16_10]